MPEMDGIEATLAIREREATRRRKSPSNRRLDRACHEGDEERCKAAGMDDYLTKPIRPQELGNLLERYARPK